MCVHTCAGALDNQKRASDWQLGSAWQNTCHLRSWVPLILEAERPHCNHWAIFLAPGILWLAFALCCFAFWLCVAHAGLELTVVVHASPKLSVIPLLQPSQWLSYKSIFTTPSFLCAFSKMDWLPSCGPLSAASLFCLPVSEPWFCV